ncbi:MAG: prepilin-type N-terminal cleavage/methylation domain-containing protein [Armatimonadota bacterium]
MNNVKRKKKGLTLVEVIISVSILFICMVGIMDAFVLGSVYQKSSEEVTTASFLGQQVLESLLSYTASESLEISAESFPEPYEKYNYTAKMAPFEDLEGFVKITVHVSTPKGSKLRRVVKLSALKLIE